MDTTQTQLEAWGNSVADAFLADKTLSMTSEIEKIATDNALNKEQIQRVCEFANHKAYEALNKTAKDRRFEFDVADAGRVIATASNTPDVEVKTASVNDWSSLRTRIDDVEYDRNNVYEKTASLYTPSEPVIEKTPADQDREYANEIRKLAESKDKLVQTEVDWDANRMVVKEAMKGIIKDLMSDGHAFEDLYKVAVASNPNKTDHLKDLFQNISDEMKLGIKLAGESIKAAQEYTMKKHAEIKDNAPTKRTVRYMKGSSSLNLKLGEYFDWCDDINALRDISSWADGRRELIRGKIADERSKNVKVKRDDK